MAAWHRYESQAFAHGPGRAFDEGWLAAREFYAPRDTGVLRAALAELVRLWDTGKSQGREYGEWIRAWENARQALAATQHPEGNSERSRQGIALMLYDVLRNTEFDDPTLTEGAKDALIEACRTAAMPDMVTEAAEERILRGLLAAGWNMAPAADQKPPKPHPAPTEEMVERGAKAIYECGAYGNPKRRPWGDYGPGHLPFDQDQYKIMARAVLAAALQEPGE